MFLRGEKMNFKKFSRALFSKLRNEINGVREFWYDNKLYVAKISYQSDNWFGNLPMLINWRKNEFQKFLAGTIFRTKKRD